MQAANIGMGWMNQQVKTEHADKTIEQMSMDELKRMMCPISGGNTEKCKTCAGFKTCRVGQRVMRMIAEDASTVYVRKWQEDDPPAKRTADEREEFIRACESGNATHWLMEEKKIGKNSATDLLSRLVKKYPGIAADYGGGRRIMQRPKVAFPETETPKQEEPAPEKSKQQKGADAVREIAREKCRQALIGGDPFSYLIKTEGLSSATATEKVRRWRKRYPDLFEGVEIPERKRGRTAKPKEEAMEETQEKTQEEDEISLGDFLTEFDAEGASEGKVEETDILMGQEPEKAEKRPEMGTDLKGMLDAKYQELKAEEETLQEQIRAMEERVQRIEEQKNALAMTLSVFGLVKYGGQ